ncbi:hypothetical protein [Pontibacter rugosus]
MNIQSKRNWLLVALFNLVVVAFLGLLLRWMFVAPVAGINHNYLLHGHSHVALLAGYTLLFLWRWWHFSYLRNYNKRRPIPGSFGYRKGRCWGCCLVFRCKAMGRFLSFFYGAYPAELLVCFAVSKGWKSSKVEHRKASTLLCFREGGAIFPGAVVAGAVGNGANHGDRPKR